MRADVRDNLDVLRVKQAQELREFDVGVAYGEHASHSPRLIRTAYSTGIQGRVYTRHA